MLHFCAWSVALLQWCITVRGMLKVTLIIDFLTNMASLNSQLAIALTNKLLCAVFFNCIYVVFIVSSVQ